MKIDKAILALRNVASKEEYLKNLCGIQLEDGAAIATDGHMLAAVVLEESAGLEPVFVPTADATAIEKAIKGVTALEVDVGEANANGHMVVNAGSCTITVTKAVTKDAGRGFPDWPQVVPQGEVTFTCAFNADYLAAIARVAKAVSERNGKKGKSPILKLEFFEKDTCAGPIRVTCSGAPDFAAILMPCRP